jgi:hypothetical protein
VVLVRPADSALVVHVLHYPEQLRDCPLAAPPFAPRGTERASRKRATWTA